MKWSEHNLKVSLTSHKRLWQWGHISHGKRWDLNMYPNRPFCGVAQCAWWAAPSPPPCWWCPCGSLWCWSQSSAAATTACAAPWTAPSGPHTARRNACVQVNFSYTFRLCHTILRNRTGHTGVQQTSTTICSRTSASASLMHWEEACVQVKNHLTPTLLQDYFSHIFYLCHTLGRTMHAGLPSSRSYSFTLNQFIINVQFCLSIWHFVSMMHSINNLPILILLTFCRLCIGIIYMSRSSRNMPQ